MTTQTSETNENCQKSVKNFAINNAYSVPAVPVTFPESGYCLTACNRPCVWLQPTDDTWVFCFLCSCSASLHSASHCISFFSHCQWQQMWKNPFSLLIFFDLHLLNSAVISCGKIVELSLMCFFLFILLDFFVVSKDSQLLNVLWNISNINWVVGLNFF